MKRQRLMMFSGFLGSGKTTTMVATAKYLKERGIKAALVTNDLGENLVDTEYARLEGIPVVEMANGCLCHDVPHFVEALHRVMERDHPDIIFAEPVGSCVGLVESVYKQLDLHFAETFELAPFTCLVDPHRYASIYMHPEQNTFDAEATYLYRSQLGDADILLINKCDLIDETELEAVTASLHQNFPDAEVIPICAWDGREFDTWTAAFAEGKQPSLDAVQIDWEYLYAGDAHMGWYNKVFRLEAEQPTDLNQFCVELSEAIGAAFRENGLEIAHYKVLCSAEDGFCKAALTSAQQSVTLSDRLAAPACNAQVNVNMRALTTPDRMAEMIGQALTETAQKMGVMLTAQLVQAFDSFCEAPAPVCG